MKCTSAILLALACTTLACGGVHGAVVPNGWTRGGRAPRDALIQLTLAVRLEGTGALESTLYAVSDPSSPRYGQHLSQAQVAALVRPASSSLSAAKEWMARHGIEGRPVSGGEYVTGTVTVAQAEAVLGVQYYTWTAGDATVTRAQDFTLPTELEGHVDFISPTTNFPHAANGDLRVAYRGGSLRGLSSSSSSSGSPAGQITPDVIARVYGTGDATTEGNLQGNHLAVAQFLGQFYSPDDLATFFKDFAPSAVGQTPTVFGPNDAGSPGVEASLDIQYAMGVANHVPTYFFSTPGQQPGSPENEPFLKWLQKVSAFPDDQLPSVISVSYGDNEDTVVYQYAVRVNVEFQKLGARGVSILFSSGDGGVAGSQSTPCTDFIPTFPAASPFVTAVGGTKLVGTDSEVAASLSSGGFSNYWPRPAYQDAAVTAYLNNPSVNLPESSRYNHTGAGFPDVAAFAENFQVVYQGGVTPVAGTSCASPTFAAVMALVNGARLVQGKPTMGWLNPWLYTHGSVFTDITSGNNPGCDTPGFHAAEGWDPITGWGSPNYNRLVKAAVFDE